MPHDPSHSGQDAPPCRRYADRPDTQYARSSSSVPIGCMDSPINDYRNIFTEQACLSRHPHQSQNLAVLTPPFFCRRRHRPARNRTHGLLPVFPNRSHQAATRRTFRKRPDVAKSRGGLRIFVGIDPTYKPSDGAYSSSASRSSAFARVCQPRSPAFRRSMMSGSSIIVTRRLPHVRPGDFAHLIIPADKWLSISCLHGASFPVRSLSSWRSRAARPPPPNGINLMFRGY